LTTDQELTTYVGMTEPSPDTRKHLVYFADPMCSWCWGFAPVIDGLARHFGERLPIALMMGGLRPGTRKPMSAEDKAYVRGHWEHVHKASGQPFDFGFFERDSFVYDTEPAARAVVTVRRLDPERAIPYFARIQRAFYAEGRDVTGAATLAALAEEVGVDGDRFAAEHVSQAAHDETARDFLTTKEVGVKGFPTLIAGDLANGYALVTNGWRKLDGIPEALEHWLAGVR
jgi:putative protein-disulfide isomerase